MCLGRSGALHVLSVYGVAVREAEGRARGGVRGVARSKTNVRQCVLLSCVKTWGVMWRMTAGLMLLAVIDYLTAADPMAVAATYAAVAPACSVPRYQTKHT